MADYQSPVASGLSKAAVYQLAENIARQIGYKPGDNILDAVRRLGGRIAYRPAWQLEDGTTGSIEIHGENDFNIFLPHHTSMTRDYFAIGWP
jgi:hypothetical protein